MREFGFPIEGYFENYHSNKNYEELFTQIENQVKDMETYPRENFIKETDEYVLIKLGNLEFEKNSEY